MADVLGDLMGEVRRARVQIEELIRRGQREQEQRAERHARDLGRLRERLEAVERSVGLGGMPPWLVPVLAALTVGVLAALALGVRS